MKSFIEKTQFLTHSYKILVLLRVYYNKQALKHG